MTIPEIDFLENTVKRNVYSYRKNPTWIKAFELYNDNNERKLGMSCRPCYMKVLKFVKTLPITPE